MWVAKLRRQYTGSYWRNEGTLLLCNADRQIIKSHIFMITWCDCAVKCYMVNFYMKLLLWRINKRKGYVFQKSEWKKIVYLKNGYILCYGVLCNKLSKNVSLYISWNILKAVIPKLFGDICWKPKPANAWTGERACNCNSLPEDTRHGQSASLISRPSSPNVSTVISKTFPRSDILAV